MKLKYIAITAFFLTSVLICQELNKIVDSISSLSTKKQVDSLINYSYKTPNNTPIFRDLNQRAYDLAKEINYTEALGVAVSNLGLWDFYDKNYLEALNKYEKSLSYLSNSDRTLELGLLYNRFGNALHQINRNEEAIDKFRKSVELRKSIDDKVGIGYAYTNIGLIYWRTGRYDSALVNYDNALRVRLEIGDDKLIASNYNNIAVLYYHWGRYEVAIDYYFKSLKIRESIDDYYGLAIVLNNIGLINVDKNELEKAKVNFYTALKNAKKSEDNTAIGYSYNGIALLFEKQNQLDSARKYYDLSLSYYTIEDNFGGRVLNLIDLAELLIKMNKFNEAEEYLNTALILSEPRSEKLRIAQVYLYRSEIASNQERNYEAIQLLQKSLDLAKELNKLDLLVDIYYRFSNLHAEINDYQNALAYYKLYKTEDEKLSAEKSSNKVMELEFEHQKVKELNEKEILLEKEKAQNSLFISFALSLAVLAVILIFIIVYRQKASKILKRKNDEIEKQKALLEDQKEELNHKNKKLNEANRTKDKFFSILAHDLKNPFSALIGYSSLLLTEYKSMTDEERIDAIKNTNTVSNNAYQLLENLLAWARSQTKSIRINPRELNLTEMVREIIQLYNEVAVNKNIKLKLQNSEDIFIISDENMIMTILRNLISNAIKFSYTNSIIDIILAKKDNDILFAVKDEGMGMDTSTLDNLFRIDVNVSNTGTNNEKGTGLGLILTKEFIQKINGTIQVKSELEKGSIFTVLLPKVITINDEK